jgi:choline-glycine betaine transporter
VKDYNDKGKDPAMPENEKNKDLKAQLWGWVLFVICAVLFTLSGVRARDILAIAASIIFLLGCAIFMIPLVKAIAHDDQPE